MRTIWLFVFLLAAASAPLVAAAQDGPAVAAPTDAERAMAALREEAARLSDGNRAEVDAAARQKRAWNLKLFAPEIALHERAIAFSASRRTAAAPLPASEHMKALAMTYEEGKDWARAEQWRRREQAELRRLGFADRETAAVVAVLALLRDRQGDAKDADALAARALQWVDGKPEPKPAVVIDTLVLLAGRELDHDRKAVAEDYASRAYAKAQTQDNLSTLILIRMYELTQRLTRTFDDPLANAAALPLLKRELFLLQWFGADAESIDLARSRVIANLNHQDRGDDAVKYLKQQIEASEREQRTVSRAYASAVHRLTSMSMQRGDLAGALPYWQRLADLSMDVFGPRHPQVAATLDDLARLQQLAGQADAAAQTRRRRTALMIDADAKPLVDDANVVDILSMSLRPFLQHIEHAAGTRELMREVDEFSRNLDKLQRRKN